MIISKYKSISPVANVDESILKIKLPNKLKFVKRRASEIINKLCYHTDLPDHEIEFLLNDNCYTIDSKYIFVIEGSFEIPNVAQDIVDDFFYKNKIINKYEDEVENYIKLLRLVSEGSIDIMGHFVFLKEGKIWTPDYSSRTYHFQAKDLFYISEYDVMLFNKLLQKYSIPLKPSYINLAFENFNLSYGLDEVHLAFLSLMIGLEILFNVGRNELRYRVSRNCAILLSKTREEFNWLFKNIKDLYDKRSALVHTGDNKNITFADMTFCRHILRKSILKILELQLTKEDLAYKLDVYGFRSKVF